MEEKKSNKKFWIIGGIILLIIIAVVIYVVVKNRKKKKLEEAKDKYSNTNPANNQRPRTTNQNPGTGNQPPANTQPKEFKEHKAPATPAVKETLPLEKKEPTPQNPVMRNSNLTDTRLNNASGPVQTDKPFVDMVDAANPQP